MLSARGLRKRYKSREVVHDFGLDLSPGEVVGLLGPNGAGKTTCFYMIVGLVPADAGQIALDGEDITALPMHERARRGIGYLPQEASVFRKLSVADNLMAVLELRADLNAASRDALELQSCSRNCRSPMSPASSAPACPAANAAASRSPARWPQPAPDPARRTLRRRRPDLGRRNPENRAPPQATGHRRADHRPQCARDLGHLRPRVYPQCRQRTRPRIP